MIIFLVWMWITNLALLIGAEFNAELERRRELEADKPQQTSTSNCPPRAAETRGVARALRRGCLHL